jgi:glutamate synthase (NADPH/NADH) small chain
MDYLPQANRRCEGETVPEAACISAKGKRVVIIGGGDTGADCLGTAHRQGAASVTQFELLPRPPASRTPDNPWPLWPNIFRVSTAHEEGGERDYCISTRHFSGEDGRVRRLHGVRVEFTPGPNGRPTMHELPGTEFEMDVDLVFLAMGFLGPERNTMVAQLGVAITDRGTVAADANKMTSIPGIFAAGDTARGQSLVVWAIAEGRQAARGMDAYLMGATPLP